MTTSKPKEIKQELRDKDHPLSLAERYEKGDGIQKDLELAKKHYYIVLDDDSCPELHPKAYLGLGRCHQSLGDYLKAEVCYEDADNRVNDKAVALEALYRLGTLYEAAAPIVTDDTITPSNPLRLETEKHISNPSDMRKEYLSKAKEYYEEAVCWGHTIAGGRAHYLHHYPGYVLAKNRLAELYKSGELLEVKQHIKREAEKLEQLKEKEKILKKLGNKQIHKILKEYELAAKGGNIQAELVFAKFHEVGISKLLNLKEAMDSYASIVVNTKASKLQKRDALIGLGYCHEYLAKRNVDKFKFDPIHMGAARNYYLQAASQDVSDGYANYLLAKSYEDEVRATNNQNLEVVIKKYYLAAADAGYQPAQSRLVEILKDEELAQAIQHFRSEAACGNKTALTKLIEVYEQGIYIKKDLLEAFKFETLLRELDDKKEMPRKIPSKSEDMVKKLDGVGFKYNFRCTPPPDKKRELEGGPKPECRIS